MSTKQTSAKEGIDKRTIRAATESMSIDRHAGEASEYDVYSESDSVYRVCMITETCECPSATYQDGACKHQRRVEMELGQRDVPDLDEETDVEMMIAAHARTRLTVLRRCSESQRTDPPTEPDLSRNIVD